MTDAPSEWIEQTSAFDRVQSVATAVSEPRPASYIAEEAHVAENTARKHLERLVNLTVLIRDERNGETVYSPDPLHTRIQIIRELLQENDCDDLNQLKSELQSEIETWKTKHNVNSPSELRALASETETAAETAEIRKTANDWELIQFRLSVVEEAISEAILDSDEALPSPDTGQSDTEKPASKILRDKRREDVNERERYFESGDDR